MAVQRKRYHAAIGKLRSRLHQSVNNSHIWFKVAAEALEFAATSPDMTGARSFHVPSRRVGKEVKRDAGQVESILKRARGTDLGRAVFVQLVAEMEAFLHDVCHATLVCDSSRLKTSIQSINHTKSIPRDEVVDGLSNGNLLDRLIEKELLAVFYSSPRSQFEYLEKITGITVDPELAQSWAEIKATRDLLAHNSGRVNETYFRKAGNKARGTLGSVLSVDDAYVADAMANLKSLSGKIASAIQRDPLPAGGA